MERIRARSPRHDPDKRNHIGGPLFAAGHAGRPHGSRNKIGMVLKDAIVKAAEEVGHLQAVYEKERGRNGNGKILRDRKTGRIIGWREGEGGLIGYLTWLAMVEPRSFAALLGRVIPLHVVGEMDHSLKVLPDKQAVLEDLRNRGIPLRKVFQSKLLELTANKDPQ